MAGTGGGGGTGATDSGATDAGAFSARGALAAAPAGDSWSISRVISSSRKNSPSRCLSGLDAVQLVQRLGQRHVSRSRTSSRDTRIASRDSTIRRPACP
jgi:hypothetical protein